MKTIVKNIKKYYEYLIFVVSVLFICIFITGYFTKLNLFELIPIYVSIFLIYIFLFIFTFKNIRENSIFSIFILFFWILLLIATLGAVLGNIILAIKFLIPLFIVYNYYFFMFNSIDKVQSL